VVPTGCSENDIERKRQLFLKIAHVISSFFSGVGGLQVCVHNIARRHVEKNNSVCLFHPDDRATAFSAPYEAQKISVFKNGSILQKTSNRVYALGKFATQRHVASLHKAYGFDLWQINGGYPFGAYLADYFKENRIPCVLRCSGDDIQISGELNYGVRRSPKIDGIVRRSYHKYSAFIAITETVRKEYLKLGIPDDKIACIPNGVDFERISGHPEADTIRSRYGIPAESKIILSVGRNHPKKGYHLIPDILGRLLACGEDIYWIVVGKGCSKIHDGSVSENLSRRLILVEEISYNRDSYDIPANELLDYYKSVDIFAMTSMLETFGIVIIEAMAAGLPVVCFEADGVKDVMDPACGVVCAIGDTDQFAQGIVSVIGSGGKASYTGSCLERASTFSWDAISDQYLEVYQRILSGP
jgi:glycosyltransferase involved in cell wall biosynthesis